MAENDDLEPVSRLTRDLVAAAQELSRDEARYLVTSYYQMQQYRITAASQVRALQTAESPNGVLRWEMEQMTTLEGQLKRALSSWTAERPLGVWARSIVGIGPVLAAGLMAHIDITRAPTVGNIWSFAGLNPTAVWKPKTKRPWNAELKVLCWKIGESFVKVKNHDLDVYGKVYAARREYEGARNDRGENAETAAQRLETQKLGKDTVAYAALASGKLPDGQLHARAKRYAVKLFLSAYHEAAYFLEYDRLPPAPYVIEHLGHAHYTAPPNMDLIPGWAEAHG